jgi:twitching motility two-component system response regulator PilH
MKKVLICDDSPTELIYLSSILEQAQCDVIKSSDGDNLLALAKQHKPDIIFLDIVMPGKDGYAACRDIIADTETCKIPVIFVSSKGKRADHIWAQMQGAKDLIQKPYDSQAILDKLLLV